MADISKFSIVTYERKPGHWRAAITRKGSAGMVVGGDKVRSLVTPDDYASETDTQFCSPKAHRKTVIEVESLLHCACSVIRGFAAGNASAAVSALKDL